jgi:hypothetical protein
MKLSSSYLHHLLPPIHRRESRGEGEGAAQGEDDDRPVGAAGPQAGGHGTHGARPRRLADRPPPPRGGEGAATGRGNGRGRGVAAGEGEGRVREAMHGRENEEHEETLGTTIEVSHWEKDSRQSREEICRLTEIQWSDRRTGCATMKPSTRRTQRYPRIPQTMYGLGIIARRSCR